MAQWQQLNETARGSALYYGLVAHSYQWQQLNETARGSALYYGLIAHSYVHCNKEKQARFPSILALPSSGHS